MTQKTRKAAKKLNDQKLKTYSVLNINKDWLLRAGQLIVRHQANHQLSPAGIEASNNVAALLQQMLAQYQIFSREVHETVFNPKRPELYLLPEVAERLTGGQRDYFQVALKREAQNLLSGLNENIEVLSSQFQEMTTAGPIAAEKILETLHLLQGKKPGEVPVQNQEKEQPEQE